MTKFLTVVVVVLGAASWVAWGQIDDFNDGNTEGWNRSDVLAEVGGQPSVFSFPGGNSVRLESPASPDPESLGASRVGLFLDAAPMTAVTVLTDVLAWDDNLAQDVGILTRGTTVGLGTTGGYVLTYDVDERKAYLSRLDAEAPSTLEALEVVLEVGKAYRFRMTAVGSTITAGIAEVAVPEVELVVLQAEDDGYPEGVSGFFTNAGVADGTTDATFDQFVIFDPTETLALTRIDQFLVNEESVRMRYAKAIQVHGDFVVEASQDLRQWDVVGASKVAMGAIYGSVEIARDGEMARFYRLMEAPPLFLEDFESGGNGWVSMVMTGNTMWELGQPRAPELMVAHSGVQAYGTDLDAPYADGATIALRSPVIDLTGELRPELSFWYFVDVTEGQEGVQVNYLDEAGTVLVGIDEIFWTKTDGWTLYEETIPEVARGRKIMIEWLFRSDGESPNGQGFFLDDVMID